MERAQAEEMVSGLDKVREQNIQNMLPVAEKLIVSNTESPERLMAKVLALATTPQEEYKPENQYARSSGSRPRFGRNERSQYGDNYGRGGYQSNYNSRGRRGLGGFDMDDDFDDVFSRRGRYQNNRNSNYRNPQRGSFSNVFDDDY